MLEEAKRYNPSFTFIEGNVYDITFFKNIKKILLVSSQDTFDMSWAEDFIKTKIIYDVLEEDPDYHYRVLEDLKRYNLK